MSFRLRIGRLGRVAGLAVIALLIVASGARAAGEWKIAEQTMTSLEASEASVFGTASESFKLSIAWYASEIECSTLATEAPTKIFPGGTGEAILKLSSCQVLGPPFVAETCKLIEPLELKVASELLLHGGKTYELFAAPSGKTSLGTIKFKEGTECPLPLSNELKGSFVGETEAGERKEQPLILNSTVEALFGGDSLSFGTHPATLKGKSLWALAAGYKGLKWAAVGEGEPWTLLRNSIPVLSLALKATLLESELLVKELGMGVACTGGSATTQLETIAEGAKLTGSTSALFTGCTISSNKTSCIVHSSGQSNGQILVSGEGEASQFEGSTIAFVASKELTFLEISGALCPLNEFEYPVSGSIKLELLSPSENVKDHLVHIDDDALFLEEVEALLDGPGGSDIALAHVTEETGATWAIEFK